MNELVWGAGGTIDKGRPKCSEEDQYQFAHKQCVKDGD